MLEKRFDSSTVSEFLMCWAKRRQPGIIEVLLDHLDERPHRPLGQPGVRLGVGARGQGQRARDQGPREREIDVGADPVAPARAGPQRRRQALGQPALDAPGGHGHDLGGHRVVERDGHQVRQHRHQRVGPIGAVDVQHPGRVRRGCCPSDGRPAAQRAGGPGDQAPRGSVTCRCWRCPLGCVRQREDGRLSDARPRRRPARPPGGAGAPTRSEPAPGSGPRPRR